MSTAFNQLTDVAELQLSYKNKVKACDRPRITTSKDAVEIFRSRYSENTIGLREEFWVMYVNRNNRVLGLLQVSAGGTVGTVVDVKFVLSGLIRLNACGVLLCHNHPSGNVQPSEPDLRLTKSIRDACKLLDCSLLDHVIITPEDSFYSFADEGTMG